MVALKSSGILLGILAAVAPAAPGRAFARLDVDAAIAAEADSLFARADSAQVTSVHVLETGESTSYYAASARTFPCPVDSVWRTLASFRNTDGVPPLKYVREAERLCGIDGVPDSCAYYIELGVSIASSWFLCDIDTMRDSVTDFRVVAFDQNHDSSLNAQVRDLPHGWLTVEYESFSIEWWMEARGDSARVGMFAVVDPDIWIPRWLFTVVSKRVFPSLLTSIEKHILEKMHAEPEEASP